MKISHIFLKIYKRVTALALSAAFLIGVLSACGRLKPEEASLLVQGTLDQTYLGKLDSDFLKLADLGENEAREAYENGLDDEVEKFIYYFDIDYPDENPSLKEEIKSMYRELLANARYTVGEAEEQDKNTYIVNVQVEPIDFFRLVVESFDSVVDSYYDKYGNMNLDSLTEEELGELLIEADGFWTQCILKLCQEKMSELSYLPAETVSVSVVRDESGVWVIDSSSLSYINRIITYYPETES